METRGHNYCKFWTPTRTQASSTTSWTFQSTCRTCCSYVRPTTSKTSPNPWSTVCKRSSWPVTRTWRKSKFSVDIFCAGPSKRQESKRINSYLERAWLKHWCKIIVWASREWGTWRRTLWEFYKKLRTKSWQMSNQCLLQLQRKICINIWATRTSEKRTTPKSVKVWPSV